ncbi:NADH dehydrogenase [ubiquinone] 1 alpha subcomplex assembly factor 4 [Pogona vitticeps]
MGAMVTRKLGKINVEARAHREIGKAKPVPAPRHPKMDKEDLSAEFQEEVTKKDDRLHTLLKDIYVDSSDPLKHVDKGESIPAKWKEYRTTRVGHLSQLDVHTVPKGTISIIEALTLLRHHQESPKIWTVGRIAEEYSLELKDVTALVTYFSPFSVTVSPPKDRKALRSP